MIFSDVYEHVIKFWPGVIDITHVDLLDDNGAYIPTLSTAKNCVELAVDQKNEWQRLMVWSMFNVFHTLCRERFKEGIHYFHPLDVEAHLIAEQYKKDLEVEGYENMRAHFVCDL